MKKGSESFGGIDIEKILILLNNMNRKEKLGHACWNVMYAGQGIASQALFFGVTVREIKVEIERLRKKGDEESGS